MKQQVPQKILNLVCNSVESDWHQHENGGGWIYKNAKVDSSARVSGDARVSGNAYVSGDACVSGNAYVSGDAWEVSPLYIQGTKHSVTLSSFTTISIGCRDYDFSYWKKYYKAIGKLEGYTTKQTKEYFEYIKLCEKYAKELTNGEA